MGGCDTTKVGFTRPLSTRARRTDGVCADDANGVDMSILYQVSCDVGRGSSGLL